MAGMLFQNFPHSHYFGPQISGPGNQLKFDTKQSRFSDIVPVYSYIPII